MTELATNVYFSVDMPWLTSHVRSLWAEGSYAKAMDTLECLIGLSTDDRYGVIRGTRKLTNGQTCVLDEWAPNLSMCMAGQYPDPGALLELAEKGAKLAQEVRHYQDLSITMIKRLMREGYPDGERIADLDYLLMTFPEEALERNGIEARTGVDLPERGTSHLVYGSNEEGWKRARGFAAGVLPDVETYISRQLELDEMPLPRPDGGYASPNGYFTQNGNYYPCEWMEHKWLALKLEEDRGEHESTLVKAARSQTDQDRINVYLPSDDYIPPEEQALSVALWCLNHGVRVPDWAKYED